MVGARVLVLELVFVVGSLAEETSQADRLVEEGNVLEGQRAGVLVGQDSLRGAGGSRLDSFRGAGGSRLERELGDGQGPWMQ